MMDTHIEVAIIATDKDGNRTATILHNRPNFFPPVGFIYGYLRSTRKKDAPPHFRFGVLDDAEAKVIAAAGDHKADDYQRTMHEMVKKLSESESS